MRCFMILSLALTCACLHALPAGHQIGGRQLSTATRLVGTWHSTSLSGDAIGLAVEDVVVVFHGNHDFEATVNMNIGGPSTYQGKYDAKKKSVVLHTKTAGAIPCKITFHGPKKMTLVGEKHDVTAVFERGKEPSSSGGWL